MIRYILIVSSCIIFACGNYVGTAPIAYPSPFQFTLVDSIPGTKDDIFVKANEWMAKAFISSKSVIQMSDKEAGKIVGKAIFSIPITEGMHFYTDQVNYTITIDAREGRYRCVLSDFHHEGDFKHPSYGSLEQSKVTEMGFDRSHKWAFIKNSAVAESKRLIIDLQSKMNSKANDF